LNQKVRANKWCKFERTFSDHKSEIRYIREIIYGKKRNITSWEIASYGHRLTGTGVYKIVSQIAREAGINKPLSPHRIRHSGITAALEATNGDVRKVQKLSRHSDLNTLMIYDDNRKNQQGEVTNLLADLV
ncbi:MAG: tyrosine-type recombinase/integrase, partial [Planktothrix sp.]